MELICKGCKQPLDDLTIDTYRTEAMYLSPFHIQAFIHCRCGMVNVVEYSQPMIVSSYPYRGGETNYRKE